MKNPFNRLAARNTTLKRILDNEVAARDIVELYLDLNFSNKYITKYGSWDNHEENIGRVSLQTYSGVQDFRMTINGMLNEIKKLKKENEELKDKVTPYNDEFWQWMTENEIISKVKKDGVSWVIQIGDSYHAFKDNFDLFNIWYYHVRPNKLSTGSPELLTEMRHGFLRSLFNSSKV